ncbi:MAG TPA: hypothetical protein VGL53_07175 [Bryobacteraceae bacterium]
MAAVLLGALEAGPLGFQDIGLLDQSRTLADCGSCAFVTDLQTIPAPSDPRETTTILIVMAVLALIGGIGLRIRSRF